MSGVTQLSLDNLSAPGDNRYSSPAMSSAVAALLQNLPHLASLKVTRVLLKEQTFSNISTTLTSLHLSETSLSERGDSDSCRLRCLPLQLPQAMNLQELHVSFTGFDASVLKQMPALRKVTLWHCWMLPDDYQDGEPEAEAVLLEALGGLKHLRHLELDKLACNLNYQVMRYRSGVRLTATEAGFCT